MFDIWYSYQLSHVCCWRVDASSDGIVVEKELINIVVIEVQVNRLDQQWHEEIPMTSSR